MRLIRHVFSSRWLTRLRFTPASLRSIETALQRAAATHRCDLRFAIETALNPVHVWRERTARDRALELFAEFHVWDTELRDGVLIYVELADRAVEIIADRGLDERVSEAQWAGVCRLMGQHFRAGRYATGALAGIDAATTLLAPHVPALEHRAPGGARPVAPPPPVAARGQLLDQPFLL